MCERVRIAEILLGEERTLLDLSVVAEVHSADGERERLQEEIATIVTQHANKGLRSDERRNLQSVAATLDGRREAEV